ncbi:hypothetical protein HYW35_04330 [Candidatus Saccharibacteria bacterium]|nr:hypothetical protein [Candidatus Saccharibacteria bacterium]
MARVHPITPFVDEKHLPGVLGCISGDKMYLLIHRGVKIQLSAMEMFCSRKCVVG